MLNLDQTKLEQIAETARAKAANDSRWTRAINKAVAELGSNPFITWQADSKSLLILSETSGNIYTANGVCQCAAFAKGQPCKHRAMARIVQRYFES